MTRPFFTTIVETDASDSISSSGKKILRFLWIYVRVTSWLAPTRRLTEMMDLELVRAFIRCLRNDVTPTQQPLGDLWFTSEMGRRRAGMQAGRQEQAAAGDPRRQTLGSAEVGSNRVQILCDLQVFQMSVLKYFFWRRLLFPTFAYKYVYFLLILTLGKTCLLLLCLKVFKRYTFC